MLGDFEHESVRGSLNLKSVHDRWEISFELDIDNGTDDLRDLTYSNDLLGEVSY
jgi:hypothetical protein